MQENAHEMDQQSTFSYHDMTVPHPLPKSFKEVRAAIYSLVWH